MVNAFAYGLGTLGRDMLAAMVSLFLMFYVTEVRGVGGHQLAAITVVMVLMRIFDAVNDPFMGMIVDNTRTRWGKFKPWMAGGAVLWAGAGVLMFTDLGTRGWGFVATLTLSYLAFEIAYTINDISYYGMLPALSRDQAERDKIGAVTRICANLGLFSVVVGIVPLTTWLAERTGTQQSAWMGAAIIAASLMLVFQLLPLLFAREQVPTDNHSTGLRELFAAIGRNDQLLWATLGMSLFMTGYTLTASLGIYYFKYVFGDENAYSVFALVLGITQVTALALFPLVSKALSRFAIHLVATIMVCAGYLLFLAADASMVLVVVSGVLLFAGQAAIQLLMVMFIADSVEYGQWKLGTRNESVTFALQPFIYKLSGGLATALVGLTLLLAHIGGPSGITPSQAGPSTVWTLKSAMLLVPLALVVVSYLVLRSRYRLDEATYRRIIDDLREREVRLLDPLTGVVDVEPPAAEDRP